MAEEVAFENGQISNFEGHVTLTLDRLILHTVVHHSSTSTYMPKFTEIEETLYVRTYVRTNARSKKLFCTLSMCVRYTYVYVRRYVRTCETG